MPEAINTRFLQASKHFQNAFLKNVLKPDPMVEKMRGERTMKEHQCSEKKARAIIRKEKAAWSKHYDSPLGKAERRIQELERHLADIKALVADPDHFDNP